jgi:vitamin B12 transporter
MKSGSQMSAVLPSPPEGEGQGEGCPTRLSRRAGFLAAVLMVALAPAAHAQRPPAPADTLPRFQVEGVTVTVGRDTIRRDALPRQVEVITATDIARTAAEDVAQLLKKQATVDVIEFPGLLAGVGMRGFRPQFSGINQRTLVLIDGRPAGASNLALLDVRGVERVEVLKGPASSLYGSNAMGGVVNLVTRRSRGPVRSTATLGYGSWDTRQGSLSTGGNLTSNIDFDLSLSAFDRASDYRVGGGNFFRDRLGDSVAVRIWPDSVRLSSELGGGEVRPHTQYGTLGGNLRLGYDLGEAWRVDWRLERFHADRVQNPGDLFATWGDSRSLKNVGRSSTDLAFGGPVGRHGLTLRAFTAVEEGENFNTADPAASAPQFVNLHSWNRWQGVQLQDAMQLGAHTLIAGFDYTRARAESERFGAPGERVGPWEPDSRISSRAAFVEGRFRPLGERLVATVGGRFDDIGFRVEEMEVWNGVSAANEEHFSVFNPSFGLQYATEAGVRVHGSGGRAFVTPTAFNVAGNVVSPQQGGGVRITHGNPELDPESSFTWDAGIGVLRPDIGLDVDATYFRTRVRDRITTRQTTMAGETTPGGAPVLSRTTYVNADEAEMQGVEWRFAYDLGARGGRFALRPFVNATHMIRAEETVATLTRDIRNVADLTVNFGVDWDDLRRFSTRLSGRYVGERADDDWNVWPAAEVRYPASLTLDWTGELRLAERFRLGVVVSNLTDENFYEVRGYPLPGRAAQLRLGVDF